MREWRAPVLPLARMEIAAHLLSPVAWLLACVLAACWLLTALWTAPWRALRTVPARQHLFFAVVLSLALLWAIAFRPVDGVTLHYLGMTTATVVLGWALASLAGALALLLLLLAGRGDAAALPLTWLLTALAPALAVAGLLWLLERSRVRNLFVFLLGIGFGGGMVVALVLVVTGLLALVAAGQGAMARDALDHVALLPLFLFSEGFINGAAVTTITVYFPQAVRGFNEDRFLGGP